MVDPVKAYFSPSVFTCDLVYLPLKFFLLCVIPRGPMFGSPKFGVWCPAPSQLLGYVRLLKMHVPQVS